MLITQQIPVKKAYKKDTISATDKYHDLPYYAARKRLHKRNANLRWLNWHFPDREVIVDLDNPNSIYAFNRFEEVNHAERLHCHFTLTNLTIEDFYIMTVPAILTDDDELSGINFSLLQISWKKVCVYFFSFCISNTPTMSAAKIIRAHVWSTTNSSVLPRKITIAPTTVLPVSLLRASAGLFNHFFKTPFSFGGNYP